MWWVSLSLSCSPSLSCSFSCDTFYLMKKRWSVAFWTSMKSSYWKNAEHNYGFEIYLLHRCHRSDRTPSDKRPYRCFILIFTYSLTAIISLSSVLFCLFFIFIFQFIRFHYVVLISWYYMKKFLARLLKCCSAMQDCK